MVMLYYADFSGMDEKKLLENYQNKICIHQYERVSHISSLKAQVSSLMVRVLLQQAVGEVLGSKELLSLSFTYGPNGKPYLLEYPELFFSLSHSGSAAVCAVGRQELGVDVQEFRGVRGNVAKRFFAGEEWEKLRRLSADEKAYESMFFRIWSVKESYIKYTGLGIRQGLHTFVADLEGACIREAENGSRKACFREIVIEGLPRYALSVCTRDRQEITVRKLTVQG